MRQKGKWVSKFGSNYKMLKDRGSNQSYKPCGLKEFGIFGVWCLALLSTIFQLYRGDQFGGGGSRREPQTLGKQLAAAS
jgi:hypothetical protein